MPLKLRASRGCEAMSTLPLLSYLMGAPPSCTSVPYAVGVKKAGMPAPPARTRSASVPCGVSSTSSSPVRYCRSNSAFSPAGRRPGEAPPRRPAPIATTAAAVPRRRTNVGRDHALDLLGAEQLAEAPVVDAGVVADGGEVLRALALHRVDERLGDAAEAKAADKQLAAVGNLGDGLVRRADAQLLRDVRRRLGRKNVRKGGGMRSSARAAQRTIRRACWGATRACDARGGRMGSAANRYAPARRVADARHVG